ncbi:MAG: DUF2752 domain-containing protein [Solirubrobacterales bacterium]|nr:DUF2752 domain-containing protein [Solirubrobacterales bacterium]
MDAGPDTAHDRRDGLLLAAAGLAPFAMGGIYAATGGDGFDSVCPFHEVTGLPCPLCGGTRAFGLVAQADPGFLHFNFFWVIAATALVLAGLAVAFTGLSFRGFWSRARTPLLLIGGAMLLGWITALANQGSIFA